MNLMWNSFCVIIVIYMYVNMLIVFSAMWETSRLLLWWGCDKLRFLHKEEEGHMFVDHWVMWLDNVAQMMTHTLGYSIETWIPFVRYKHEWIYYWYQNKMVCQLTGRILLLSDSWFPEIPMIFVWCMLYANYSKKVSKYMQQVYTEWNYALLCHRLDTEAAWGYTYNYKDEVMLFTWILKHN